MKCPYCGEEMEELELYDLGYGQRGVEYECPNLCDWLLCNCGEGDLDVKTE